MNAEKYVVNGKVRRSIIATDVKNGHLTKEDIVYLCSLPEVQASFIETCFVPEKSEKEWNANYLEEISCAAIAEVFNQDYLLHLREVSDSLNRKRQRLKMVLGICIGFSLLCLAIAIIAFLI